MDLDFKPAGDKALVVECGNAISEEINRRVRRLNWAIDRRKIPGIQEIIPTYRSLLVLYEPELMSPKELTAIIRQCASEAADAAVPEPKMTVIPVAYGGVYGPDLSDVAKINGLTPAEVIKLHTSRDYLIYMLGFTPGFPYLGGMAEEIAVPRLAEPRLRIPAGSVGIAGGQTGVYPVESPGGWRLIGRTPLRLYDPEAAHPVLLRAGDYIRFQAIEAAEYECLAAEKPVEAVAVDNFSAAHPLCEVVHGGLLTTIQDLGRYGYQQFGVPTAGAMDEFAFRIANLLVGNQENASALEVTASGPVLTFRNPTVISVTGGDLMPLLNSGPIPMWESIAVSPDDILSFGGRRSGCRAYLAMAGGVEVPEVMGSRSTYLRGKIGGLAGRKITAGDVLPGRPLAACSTARPGRRLPAAFIPKYGGETTLRAVPGPQADCFPPESLKQFTDGVYRITAESDRMGYRLQGPGLHHKSGADIISDGLPLGAVQVPGHGNPIIMLADRQTTGGYAKIATVIAADLPQLAQMMPGQHVRFRLVSPEEAREIYLGYKAELRQCAVAIDTVNRWNWRLTVAGETYTVTVTETRNE
ncbi:MAG: 5-oxoprolinase subunit PxpB [bacterium]